MSISCSATLVDVLREWQFLEASQLYQLARNRLLAYTGPRQLTRDLVQRGWLSPYQANRLIQGKGHELVLGPYRLIEPLGEGHLGRVFKARDVRMSRLVALKIIHKERLSSLRSIERLCHEATVVARLSHPNIVRAFGAGRVGNTYVLAMEYLPGLDMEALVQTKGRLTVTEACDFIRQASLGLQHAHERGIVHRNVKPRNLMVTREGPGKAAVVKLVDFCLSLVENEARPTPVTPALLGPIVGTIDFISPEQAADPEAADTRSDIFSLGCTLFYLLTARLPFEGDGLIDKLMVRYWKEAPLVRTLRPEVPGDLDRVVAKMLARDPGQRYQNPSEVAFALTPFVQVSTSGSVSLPPAAIPISPARKPPTPTPRSLAVEPGDGATSGEDLPSSPLDLLPPDLNGGKRFLAGAGALLFLLAITFGAAFLSRGPKKTARPRSEEVDLNTPAFSTAPKPTAKKEKQEANQRVKVTPRSGIWENKPSPKPVPEESRPESKPKPEPAAQAKGQPEPTPKPARTPSPTTEPKTKIDAKPATKPVTGAGKLPVPDSAGQLKAETLIKDLFKPEYSRKAPADLRALAEQLFEQGLETRDDMTARYVLFREALDLASQAGDVEEAFKAVDALAKEYAVDALELKTASLAAGSKASRSPAANKLIADAALPLVNDAVVADRYDLALRLLVLADMAARRGPSALLTHQVEARLRAVREIETEFKKVKPALETLQDHTGRETPNPNACLEAGRFLCFMKGEWDRGLPLLAGGSVPSLRCLAQKDLAQPAEAEAQVPVGDGWWDVAESQTGVARQQLRMRARYWYKQALPELQGLTRTKVERRIHPPKS